MMKPMIVLLILVVTACGNGSAANVTQVLPETTPLVEPTPTTDIDRPGVTIKRFVEALEANDVDVNFLYPPVRTSELQHYQGLIKRATGYDQVSLGRNIELYEFETVDQVAVKQEEIEAEYKDSGLIQAHFTNGYLLMFIPDESEIEKYKSIFLTLTP